MGSDSAFGFEQNEDVVVAHDAPADFRPSEVAWVISWRIVENEDRARAVGYPVGTQRVLIEYEDGSDAELPVEFLRHR